MLKAKYLSEEAIIGLKKYKYKSGEYSFLDNLLTPFWNWSVTLLPLWLAPNMVTLSGFFLVIYSSIQILIEDLSMRQELHSWVSIAAGVCLWGYQTLDAIDGKQARRTGQSSPLGQLFDHGCDAWSTVFVLHQVCQILLLFPNTIFFVWGICALCIFYFCNWEEYHTEILRTSVAGFGLTECQYMIIISFIANGLIPGKMTNYELQHLPGFNQELVQLVQDIVMKQLQYTPEQMKPVIAAISTISALPLVHVICYIGCSTTVLGCLNNLITVFLKSKHSFAHQLEGLIPMVMIVSFVYIVFTFSEVAWTKPALVIYVLGPFFSLSCSRMIIGSVTHTKFSVFRDLHLTVPFIVSMGIFPANKILGLGLDESTVFFSLIGANLFVYFLFVVNAIAQICEALDIYCLTIKHPKKD